MTELKMKDDRKDKQNRSPLSPKLRYNVLRRDGFTCQYCGRTGQERELEIDHIVPVSKGGTNDIGNLQTACIVCNRGKLIDELVTEKSNIQIIEKVVYREVPVEKIIEKVVYKDAIEKHVVEEVDYNKSTIDFIRQNPSHQQIEAFIEQEAKRRSVEIGINIPNQQAGATIMPSCLFDRFSTQQVKIWALAKNNPELAEACTILLDAMSDKPTKKYTEAYTTFAKLFQTYPVTETYKQFCFERVKNQKNELIKWSKETTNPVLKAICLEVLKIGETKQHKGEQIWA